MIVSIHFSVGEYDDNFILEADTVEKIREKADKELKCRGLDLEKNNVYSMVLKE